MNRLLLVAGSAAVGAVGLVAVVPRVASPALTTTQGPTSPAAGSGGSSSGDGSSSSSSAPSESGAGGSKSTAGSSSSSPGASKASPSSAAQTVTSNEMWNGYGPIQVRITVDNGQLTAVELIEEPSDGRSRFINSRAVPILVSQALQAQSAQIDGVSGATLTSQAFMQALDDALQKVT